MEKDFVKTKPCKKVDTFDDLKKKNGWLLEIVSDRDGFTKHLKGQVYLTTIKPGAFKGFHLHALADYFITCVKGKIKDVVYLSRTDKKETDLGESDFKTIYVPKGYPHGMENVGEGEAYALIYRYPSWSSEIREQLDIGLKEIRTKETWKKINEFVKSFRNESR